MNVSLLSAAVHHAAFLNTLQTAVLYDLCMNADEEGEVKPNIEAMALRWRVRSYAIKAMLKDLATAGLIEKSGQRVVVRQALLLCQQNCGCPSPSPSIMLDLDEASAPAEPPEAITEPICFLDEPEAPKKVLDPLRPNPGSLNGIWAKLKVHWRTRWGTPVINGYIERQLGETVRGILSQPEGSLDTLNKFERAFVNYLTAAKDSESGKISLKGFGNTWGVWVDKGDSIKNDAKAMLEDALEI